MPEVVHQSSSLDDTARIASRIAEALQPGDVVTLEGDLGAGKTTLIRELVACLGVDRNAVSSPTFVIANEYVGSRGLHIVHIDAYRLSGDDSEELALLGWDRMATDDTIVLIEWADRIENLIDRPALRVTLEHAGETSRIITMTWPDDTETAFEGLQTVPREPAKCPVTGELVSPDAPHYPFSSERARWADLYGWFNESHQINRPIEEADLDQES